MMNKRRTIFINCILMLLVSSWAQSAQDELRQADKLWITRHCLEAFAHLENVRKRINDFPDNVHPEIENRYIVWQDTIAAMQLLEKEIDTAVSTVLNIEKQKWAISELQSARDSLNILLHRIDEIICIDMREPLEYKISNFIEGINSHVDGYIDTLLAQNIGLKTSVDSLGELAKRYRILLPLLDSLRAIIARSSEDIEHLQAQVDSIIAMATQTTNVTGGEEFVSITTPIGMIANALLRGIENRIIAIGEGTVRPVNYMAEQKDSLLNELSEMASWLDTSLVAKNAPQKSAALRELCFEYIDMIYAPKKSMQNIKWFALAILAFVVIIAIVIAIGRWKNADTHRR